MSRPWYPFYWGDYSGKAFHLTQGQHGAYFLLLRFIYTTGKPIPANQCYSIAQALLEQEKSNVDFVLDAFFRLEDGFWYNERAFEIIQESDEKHKKRVNAGSKGGSARSSNAQAMLKQPQPQPQPKKKGEGKPSPPPSPPVPDWIDPGLWAAFKEMRKGQKKPLTAEAERLIIREMERLRGQGHDPTAVLEQSIRKNWQDVYPLKGDRDENNSRPSSNSRTAQPASRAYDNRDPATRARDIGEEIIAKRNAQRAALGPGAAEGQPAGTGRTDAPALSDLCQPENLR